MEDILPNRKWVSTVIGLTFIVERGLMLRWGRGGSPCHYENAVGSLPFLRRPCRRPCTACEASPSLPRALLSLLTAEQNLDLTKDENVNALQTRARHGNLPAR